MTNTTNITSVIPAVSARAVQPVLLIHSCQCCDFRVYGIEVPGDLITDSYRWLASTVDGPLEADADAAWSALDSDVENNIVGSGPVHRISIQAARAIIQCAVMPDELRRPIREIARGAVAHGTPQGIDGESRQVFETLAAAVGQARSTLQAPAHGKCCGQQSRA